MKPVLESLNALADQVAESKGLRVYDLALVGTGQGKTLRVFIDRSDRKGISLEDCSQFSHGLSALLDQDESIIDGAYNLEVSSPGVERPLSKQWHYAESVGETVLVTLNQSLLNLQEGIDDKWAARKKVQGTLKSVESDRLEMDFEGMNLQIPMKNVIRANVVFDFNKK